MTKVVVRLNAIYYACVRNKTITTDPGYINIYYGKSVTPLAI